MFFDVILEGGGLISRDVFNDKNLSLGGLFDVRRFLAGDLASG